MPMCVCGHNEDEHHLATMSVPLTNPVPIYPVTYPAFAGQPHPTATYDRLECHCGCCAFEALTV
jgi:hypothetical protein